MKIPDNAILPPGIEGAEMIMQLINQAYNMNHRGGDIGYNKFEKIGDRSRVMECKNPYPCAFDEGLLQGFLTKFSSGGFPRVSHTDKGCRMDGDQACKYNISW